MAMQLKSVDPGWAWSEYKPREDRPWNRALAAHLYRRAGFAGHSADLDDAVKAGPKATVTKLFSAPQGADEFRQDMNDLASAIIATGKAESLPAWWLYRMLHTPNQLQEKTTLFWHGHFATSAAKVQDPKMMLDQNELLRTHALGRFDELLQLISRDSAMLIYLDSVTNRKAHPNENYARELMELFSLGVGNYSEVDVQEVARCFTGWEIYRGRYRFSRPQHDPGIKNILGESGNFGGEDAVAIVLKQPAAPQFIARKLIRYFVADAAEIPDPLIEPLARQLRDSNFTVAGVIERILSSELFFSDLSIGRKIRSPVELTIGLMRALEGSTNSYRLAEELDPLGQVVFFPPSVKGWDGGRSWINSSTLLGRANLVKRLMHDKNSRFAGADLASLIEKHNVDQPEKMVHWLLELLLAKPVPANVRQDLINLAPSDSNNRSDRIADLISAIGALPEFQLG